jgi:hypothetical protein
MNRTASAILAFVSACAAVSAQDQLVHSFKKIQLTDKFWCEGATMGDFNHDGRMDVVSGPYWYEGPDFQKRHEYYPATKTFTLKKPDGASQTIEGFEGALGVNNTYSDNFFAFSYDFNKDGWDDILILGFPGENSAWYENPKGRDGHWQKHVVLDVTENESPTFVDITGDGRPEIVCSSKGFYGYAEPDWSAPDRPWKWHSISPNNNYHRFTHGMGVGDVNGDGRPDLLEKDGWWEQPKTLAGDPVWTFRKFPFGTGGAQMYAYDVNGDGRNDVISSLAAHGYGLAWYENVNDGNGGITFKEHIFMNKEPKDNKYGIVFSQLHAVDLVDMDGDGIKDIITGKRFWAHGAHGDADPSGAAVVYWFKLVRRPGANDASLGGSASSAASVDFIPYLIDDNSGVGTQVVAGRINNKTYPDIVVGNKKGTFVLLHEVKKVSKSDWEKAQPKPQ